MLIFSFSVARLISSFHNSLLSKYSPIKLFVKQIKDIEKLKKFYARSKKGRKVFNVQIKIC